MSASVSNRALRTLVAEIAELGNGDLGAILADLDAAERDQLLELIAEYREGARSAGGPPDAAPVLSEWLIDRLTGTGASGMTPAAAELLQQSAVGRGWRTISTGRGMRASRPGFRTWLGGQP